MLYISIMNDRLLPEALQTTYGTACKLQTWALVALGFSAFGHWYLRKPDLSIPLRMIVALAPLIPSFLYARDIARWIRGLDELQRRIQSEAWLFAATGTIFVATSLTLMAGAGLLQGSRLQHGLGWEGTYALSFLLWAIGCARANRRYR
jgi:hypothetical protein